MSEFCVEINFTPRAHQAMVANALPASLRLDQPYRQYALLAARGDHVDLPEAATPLYVVGRSVVLHPQDSKLLLVLGLAEEV